MIDKKITFIKVEESHIPLIHNWLSAGEAQRWYGCGEPTTEAGLRQKYLVDKPRGGTHSFIITYNGEPIGHIQYYRAIDYPDWCTLVSGQPNDYGLDLFLGRDDLIGHGIGTRVVKEALAELVFSNDDAMRCMLGPSPENKRAIRCYEKCGFQYARTVICDDGETEYIMIVERPNQ